MTGTLEPSENAQEPNTTFEVIHGWADLPRDHARAALKAFNLELERAHELRLAQIRREQEKELRQYRLFMTGLILGFVVVMAMLSAAVFLGMQGQPELAGVIVTVTIAIVTIFVLRKHDPNSVKLISEAASRMAPPRGVSNRDSPSDTSVLSSARNE